ncbi:hypothetical protein D9M68_428270 [compost metagenome]|uniref:DUF1097 domain-containing protein n=1 Tax=Pseudomonas jinjuensis TaxID=198616 RepID=A0A1H0HL27_9PSED|nr:hypothetical protein [Pseudomonas jinjuensis]SDO19541.1 hypothetical protein SAMN05216193_108270 [Pseudomonas jinjuensis]
MSNAVPEIRPKLFADAGVLVAWVVGVAIVGVELGFKAIWAPFFCAILFSIYNKDVKRIPEIICGAVTGVWLAWAIVVSIGLLNTLMEPIVATALVLFVGVYIIFCGGLLAPLFINQSAFVFLTVALATHLAEPPLEISGLIVVGGGILLAGEVALLKLLARIGARRDVSAS